jgi:hypothetical protein
MSLTAFKKKSVIQFGSNRSGKPPGGVFLPQGPFGSNTSILSLSLKNVAENGFSINGGTRNTGYIGKSSSFSKNFTPFKGENAKGNGGHFGTYYNRDHIYPFREVYTAGTQFFYIKPSVLSTYGMLAKKYRWIYNGVYPNNIVSPTGVGNNNLSENTSQGVYIQNLSSAVDCVNDVNNPDKYINYYKKTGPYGCNTQNGGRYSFNQITSNAPYTKTIKNPLTASQYILKIQRKCVNNSIVHIPAYTPGNGSSCFGVNILSTVH